MSYLQNYHNKQQNDNYIQNNCHAKIMKIIVVIFTQRKFFPYVVIQFSTHPNFLLSIIISVSRANVKHLFMQPLYRFRQTKASLRRSVQAE